MRRALRSATLLLLVGVVGCALSPAPVDHYYRLEVAPPATRFETPRMAGTLRVNRPRAEALTDSSHLVFRRSDNPAEVQRDPYQLWSDAPSLLLRDALIDTLHASGIAQRIVPPGLRSPVDYTLSTRIMKLERIVDGSSERALLELEFSLEREGDRKMLFHRRYQEAEAVPGGGAARAVEAYDRALARVLEKLLVDLDQSLPRDGAGLAQWRR